MTPLDIIIMALAAGAIAGLKDSTQEAIKDLYFGLKNLVERKYGEVYLSLLEKEPASKTRQEVIKEELAKTSIQADMEVLTAAKSLLLAVQEHAQNAGTVTGLEMNKVIASLVEIDHIIASEGTGARISQGTYGEIRIKEVVSGKKESKSPKAKRR